MCVHAVCVCVWMWCGCVHVVCVCVCVREREREREKRCPLIKCSLVSYAYLTALIPFCSPIGEVFRSRLHQFPSLVNCCTINWFSEWPDKALCSVATNFMQDITEIDVSNSISICLSVCLSVCVSVLPAFLYTVKVLGRRKIECVCVYVCGGSISVNFIYLMSIVLCQSCNEGELIGLAFSKPQL